MLAKAFSLRLPTRVPVVVLQNQRILILWRGISCPTLSSLHQILHVGRGLLKRFPWYKATEFRQIILYTGLVLFKKHLNRTAYSHFLCLSMAYRLISSSSPSESRINAAEKLLIVFVKGFKPIYVEHNFGDNVHNLLHLADCVLLHGNVNKYSAYKYENFIVSTNRSIRGKSNILQQVHNPNARQKNIPTTFTVNAAKIIY